MSSVGPVGCVNADNGLVVVRLEGYMVWHATFLARACSFTVRGTPGTFFGSNWQPFWASACPRKRWSSSGFLAGAIPIQKFPRAPFPAPLRWTALGGSRFVKGFHCKSLVIFNFRHFGSRVSGDIRDSNLPRGRLVVKECSNMQSTSLLRMRVCMRACHACSGCLRCMPFVLIMHASRAVHA